MEWIKVEDRLPESNTQVLTFDSGWIEICDFNKEDWGQEGFWLNENGGEYSTKVDATHWQPLPTAPK